MSLPPDFDRVVAIQVHQGDCLVSSKADETFSTVLGSCISACIRDKATGTGGMNHFLLAEAPRPGSDRFGTSARYGAFAMEQLINTVLARGSGRKSELEIKVFGGGNINAAMNDVGARNAAFVREFLRQEGYLIAGEDLGGAYARRVLFKPANGRAFVKRLDSATGAQVVRQELDIAGRQVAKAQAPDIELF